MDDAVEVARLLDILGNRNRRRIIELLRQKPCFVTEISDTLTISPKAVIDHLQMMEREAILSFQTDERRRKYYFLANDILVDVSLKEVRVASTVTSQDDEKNERLKNSVVMLGRMITAHDQMQSQLEQINHDIETKINDIARNHKDLFGSDREITVIIALSHYSLNVTGTGAGHGNSTGQPHRYPETVRTSGTCEEVRRNLYAPRCPCRIIPTAPTMMCSTTWQRLSMILSGTCRTASMHALLVIRLLPVSQPEVILIFSSPDLPGTMKRSRMKSWNPKTPCILPLPCRRSPECTGCRY